MPDSHPDQILAHSALAQWAQQGGPVLDQTRRDLLELAAAGAPIGDALNAVVRAVARVRKQETRAAIFILDPEGAKLRFSAALGLAEGYTSLIDHFPLGPRQPSCGKAAYIGEDVIVGDVATDAAWAPLLALAQEHGIRACWSFLLKGPQGRILGTFALYHRVPCVPDLADLEEVRYFVNIASLMIDRHVSAQTHQGEQEAYQQRLQAANHAKDVFIATLAHELRTPIAAIGNGLELLQLRGDQSAMRDRVVGSAQRQLAQMQRLVEDLLDVSRLERGELLLRRADMALGAALALAVEGATPMVDGKGQHLSVSMPAEHVLLHADCARVSQMVGNLLGNASKFTAPGGAIFLHAALEQGTVVVRVRDTGIGIAAAHLASVFEIFSQVDGPHAGGLGIGLNLVRQLAEMHGGSISVHSDGPGAGAEFVLRLPCLPA